MMNTNAIRKSSDIVGAAKNLDLNCLDEGKSDKAIYTYVYVNVDKNVENSLFTCTALADDFILITCFPNLNIML